MKKIIVFCLFLLLIGCTKQKVYNLREIIEYKNVEFSVTDDDVTEIIFADKSTLYVDIKVENRSEEIISCDSSLWQLEIDGKMYENTILGEKTFQVGVGESKTVTLSYEIPDTKKAKYLILSFEEGLKFKIKLADEEQS